MDGTLFDDEVKARQVNEILGRHPLPSILVHAEAKPDWTWEGDPVTYVWGRLAHDNEPTADEMRDLTQFMQAVKADVRALPVWQFVHFRLRPASSA